jgi:hypothetical protein
MNRFPELAAAAKDIDPGFLRDPSLAAGGFSDPTARIREELGLVPEGPPAPPPRSAAAAPPGPLPQGLGSRSPTGALTVPTPRGRSLVDILAGDEPKAPPQLSAVAPPTRSTPSPMPEPHMNVAPMAVAKKVPPLTAQAGEPPTRSEAKELGAVPVSPAAAPPVEKPGIMDRFLMGIGAKSFPEGMGSEDRLKTLRARASIAEGLGRMGAGFAARSGHRAEPYFAEGTREDIAREEDRITAEEAAFYREQGFPVPVGISRSMVQRALPQIAGQEDREFMRTHRQSVLDQRKAEHDTEKERARLLAEERAKRHGERKSQALTSAMEKFTGDPLVKLNLAALDGANKAIANLETNTSTGDVASFVQLARAAGEKGVLSNQDITMYRTRLGLLNRISDMVSQAVTGRLSGAQRGEVMKLLEAYRDAAQTALRDRAAEKSRQYGITLEGLDVGEDLLSEVFTPGGTGRASMDVPGGGTTGMRDALDPAGKEWELPADTDLSKYAGWRWK